MWCGVAGVCDSVGVWTDGTSVGTVCVYGGHVMGGCTYCAAAAATSLSFSRIHANRDKRPSKDGRLDDKLEAGLFGPVCLVCLASPV